MNDEIKKLHTQKGKELTKQMTVRELTSQLKHESKPVKRLGILPYNWWNECLHGVARAGVATVFPQAICMASTFSDEILYNTAQIISTEARAKYNDSQRKKDYGIYKGLTMWSPNINIYRDPRWGRGHETYGEDPYLTGFLGVAFIKGLQGDDPKYIKTAACAKHFAVHSGPEADRHSFNAVATKKDMFETYLPAFKKAVQDGKVCGIMGAYNKVNGEASCASDTLIKKLVRSSWGFDGYFVSDCSALCDIVKHHKIEKNPLKGAAFSINKGCQLECGRLFRFLPISYKFGYVSRETLENAAATLLGIRSSLGMFSNDCPFDSIGIEENASPVHEHEAIKVAEKGIVLLKNNGILPIRKDEYKILVTGYNAENDLAYLGNYFGDPTSFVKVPQSVREMNKDTDYAQGYAYNLKQSAPLQKEAVEKAKNSDIVFVCTGLDCSMEGEEAGELLQQGGGGNLGKQGDRETLDLPIVQQELLERLIETGKRIVILNFSGGCIDFRKYENRVDAIVQCWYPGAKAGTAIANILFGEISPSGKLPITFYNSIDDVPDFSDYSMENRTYRYFKGDVQYPFGYGLTYTNFELTKAEINGKTLRCSVKNTGNFDCDEVLQIYLTQPKTDYENPIRSLIKVRRFALSAGEEKEIIFDLRDSDFYSVNENGDTVYLSGEYALTVCDGQNISSEKITFINAAPTEVIEVCPI